MITILRIDTKKLVLRQAELGLTLKKIAAISGLSESGVHNIFEDKCNPRPDTIGRIAKALEIETEKLLLEDTS